MALACCLKKTKNNAEFFQIQYLNQFNLQNILSLFTLQIFIQRVCTSPTSKTQNQFEVMKKVCGDPPPIYHIV
ncbi:hypothetical protein TTHERM_00191890 (macronuclear) [Tetrahymena thermophila SB210]|uniref:Uncharacterized protein n=1 Tax=Tetrahymena thermophila (strain SB210) TaxID=312017 RepID=I7M1K6_TETTS|nr:hypothetical protein TTHERM_00191890 [Tetrahymena thermophila SB210]EAR96520.1 hypothetical protein TTHERM_00191890 [Tetrahymena thermophila SB210]|eukprot:XP_001016765.1 hypothetical protein TTHERM_00191890 [Tetrahymena thermophila SB210]